MGRIISYDEKVQIAADDYLVVDSSIDGTRKIKASLLADADAIEELSESVSAQFPEINGVILPPKFAVGSRYVDNGLDKWATNTNRISFAQGTYINLKQGDVVTKDSAVYVFGGGYSTDNGVTFTTIPNGYGPYTAPSDGLYFFNLAKPTGEEWTAEEALNGWKYISFNRADSMMDTVNALASDTTLNNVKDAIGYEVGPIDPTEFYTMPNTGKGLNYLGQLVDESVSDTSDYIELNDMFYDVVRIVTNTTKYGLGSICYYKADKTFIKRVQPGTSYDFSIYNGETVVWLGIDKTVANAKYVRFTARNDYGFRYWIVYNGYKAGILDRYKTLPLYGKKIVNFGDSIFGNTRPPKDISTYLAELTGATVYNCGFGGCEMSTHAIADYTPFSMCSLADAVATGIWTSQETNAALSEMPSYFPETVALLKNIDFSNIDIVTIGYGTNDWNNGSPLDNGGKADMSYFADALRYSIETLLTAFPNLRIFVCTQTYRFFMDANNQFVDDCKTHTNSHGKTLTDFVNKTMEVAEEYNLPCINNYNIGMNKYSRSQYFSATDGTHPTYVGNRLIASHIAKTIY